MQDRGESANLLLQCSSCSGPSKLAVALIVGISPIEYAKFELISIANESCFMLLATMVARYHQADYEYIARMHHQGDIHAAMVQHCITQKHLNSTAVRPA